MTPDPTALTCQSIKAQSESGEDTFAQVLALFYFWHFLDIYFALRKLQMEVVATTAVSVEKVNVDSGGGERHTLYFVYVFCVLYFAFSFL